MSYAEAIRKAWDEVTASSGEKNFSVRLLADTYHVDADKRTILSGSSNIPAKDFIVIILLHYLVKKLAGLPALGGEWISFNQIPGGEGYYPAFRKRTINTILRKHGADPSGLLTTFKRFNAHEAGFGDAGVVIDALDGVPMLVTLWKGDEEFGPDANILFDKNITSVFCTEDIVVLTEIVAHAL